MASAENTLPDVSCPHILVVDDDERISSLLVRYLLDHDCIALSAHDASSARALLADVDIDAAILDIMMPGETGLELARSLRAANKDFPIIFLTALGEADDRIAGLEAGADDYLPKPFEPRELLLRLQALLRRTMRQTSAHQACVGFGDLIFDTGQGVLKDGQDRLVDLTDAERELLIVLAKNIGQTLSREDLAAQCGVTSSRAIDVQITRLRRKIETGSADPRYLQTVRGQGYVLRGRTIEESGA